MISQLAGANIGPFPQDVLKILFCHLRARDVVGSISRVCKTWRRIVHDGHFFTSYKISCERYQKQKWSDRTRKRPFDKLKSLARLDARFEKYLSKKSVPVSFVRSDYEFVLAQARGGRMRLHQASAELQKRREIVLACVSHCGRDLYHADPQFQNDREIVLMAAMQGGGDPDCKDTISRRALSAAVLEYSAPLLCQDRHIVLTAVSKNGKNLQFAAPNLQADREIVLAAVRSYGKALRYAQDVLKSDREIVLAAVQEDFYAFAFASVELQRDPEVLQAVSIPVANNRTLKGHYVLLGYASFELKRDRDYVLKVVQINGYNLEHAAPEFKADREIVLSAVEKDGQSLAFASPELKNDREVVLKAIKRDYRAYKAASQELKNDRSFLKEALKANPKILTFLPLDLQVDEEIAGPIKKRQKIAP